MKGAGVFVSKLIGTLMAALAPLLWGILLGARVRGRGGQWFGKNPRRESRERSQGKGQLVWDRVTTDYIKTDHSFDQKVKN